MNKLVEQSDVRDWEIPLRKRDGQIRIVLGSAELIEVNGEPCALLVVADITERKEAEEALNNVSRKLVEAQEAERTRIARELHDDINQRLALVAVTLTSVLKGLQASDLRMRRTMEEASASISGLGNDIQAISRRLHSSSLEYLGLKSAAAGLCREFGERHDLEIAFHSAGLPEVLPDEVSLGLFRVLQEALQNAVKHSGTRKIEVFLLGESTYIQLLVRDFGKGFDPGSASHGQGLGLTSMKERLRLVGGDLAIDSKPRHGTTVIAHVPVGSAMASATAIG
jgi:signal transduction histidine kinase